MRKIISLFISAVFVAVLTLPAQADLLEFGDLVDVETDAGEFQFPEWYMDANRLKLQACLDEAVEDGEDGVDFCLAAIVIEDEDGEPVLAELEFLYFLAEAEIADFPVQPGAGDTNTRVRLIMALEGFVDEEDPLEGPFEGVFNAIIITGRGFAPLTTYHFTTPYGNYDVTTDDRGRIRFEDPDPHPEGPSEFLFEEALRGPIQKFVYWDSDLPQTNNGFFYIGDPGFEDPLTGAEGHTIFGSPFGTNFLRVTGPNNFEISTDRFAVVGKVFFGEDQNLAPLANFDVAVARPGESVRIDVLANDMMQGDVPINPTSLEKQGAISVVTGGGSVATEREIDKLLLNYTAPTTPGLKIFNYTAETFTGMADTADVAVFVEDLQIANAEYRARTGRWTIEGTSTFRDLVVPFMEDGVNRTAYVTGLSGAQEMPPRTTMASGHYAAIFTQGDLLSFDFILEVHVPEGTVMNRAHIHLGETGRNGGILFDLCGEPVSNPVVPCAVSPEGIIKITGNLTETDFKAVGDVTTFTQALQAIQDGRTYVNVHSVEFPPGEIRGQIGRNVISLRAGEHGPAIGAAEVQEGGHWSFDGKSIGSPGEEPHVIHAESGVGITETADLRLR